MSATDPADLRHRPIRAWRAAESPAAPAGPHPALAAALLFAGGTPGDATRRLRRALRAERRLASRGDRHYDVGRHLALLAACAPLARPAPARERWPAPAGRAVPPAAE